MSIQIKCRECNCGSLSYGIRKTTNKYKNISQTKIKPSVNTHPHANKEMKERQEAKTKFLHKRNRKEQSTRKVVEILTTILSPRKALIEIQNSNKTSSSDMKKKILRKYCQWKMKLVK